MSETLIRRCTTSTITVPRALKLVAILLVVAVGLTHLVGASPHYRFAPYIGVGFVVNFLGALVAAVGIYRNALWGWLLGALVAGGALMLYVVSRTVGLPGYEHAVGRWFGPLAIISFIVEVVFVALFVVAVSRRRS
jgi:hypothetical protein